MYTSKSKNNTLPQTHTQSLYKIVYNKATPSLSLGKPTSLNILTNNSGLALKTSHSASALTISVPANTVPFNETTPGSTISPTFSKSTGTVPVSALLGTIIIVDNVIARL